MPFQSQIPQLYRWLESQYGTGYSYNPSFDATRVTSREMGGGPNSGGSPWSRGPTVDLPRSPRGITGVTPPAAATADDPTGLRRGRIERFRGEEIHPGGDPYLEPEGNVWNPDPGPLGSGGEPIVQIPRSPFRGSTAGGSAGSGLGHLVNIPISSGRGGVTTPAGNAGNVWVGNEYRGSQPPADAPYGQVQIDPSTGQPFTDADTGGLGTPPAVSPEVRRGELVDEGESGSGGFPGGGGQLHLGEDTFFNYGTGHRQAYHDPNTAQSQREGLNMRIAMATAPGAPNFGGSRRPQSDEGANVNMPLASGFNLRRDEGGGFYRTPLRRGNSGAAAGRMRAWAELLTTAQGRARAAGMTRGQQQAYAGVGG